MKPIVLAVTARVDAELYLERSSSCQGKDGAPSKDKLAGGESSRSAEKSGLK